MWVDRNENPITIANNARKKVCKTHQFFYDKLVVMQERNTDPWHITWNTLHQKGMKLLVFFLSYLSRITLPLVISQSRLLKFIVLNAISSNATYEESTATNTRGFEN